MLAEGQQSAFGEKILEAMGKGIVPGQGEMETTAEVWSEGLVIRPRQGRTVYLPYTEARKITAENYRVEVSTDAGPISLQALGAKYDSFASRLTESWADALARALLMSEPVTLYETRAKCTLDSGFGQTTGICRARILHTSLVLLPNNAIPVRISYSGLTSYASEAYTIKLQSPIVGAELSQMGANQKFFYDKLVGAVRTIEQESLNTVRQILPSIGFAQLQATAKLMAEGRAAKRKDLEAISPEIWRLLEQNIRISPLADVYGHLTGLGLSSLTATGLWKTLDNVYVWFLIPIFGSTSAGGNTLAMEVVSETGHATYLYWVIPRNEFSATNEEAFRIEADLIIEEINDAMIATGFRREPIYLSDQQLQTTEYSKYLYAARNLEPLKFLRERYYARIIHSTPEQWKTDLADALLFNTSVQDNHALWSKSEVELSGVESEPRILSQPTPVSGPAANASSVLIQAVPQAENSQRLSLQTETGVSMSQPVLASALERTLTVDRIEGYQEGKVRLWLNDNEMDHQSAVVIRAEDASRLGAYPGSKVKLSLQKL